MSRPFHPLEFVLVIGIAFGQFMVSSVAMLLSQSSGDGGDGALFGAAHLTGVMAYELIVTPFLLLLLYGTGWRLRHLGGAPQWDDAGRAAALFFVSYAVYYLSAVAASVAYADEPVSSAAPPGLALVAMASLVNGTFEEVFVCGYVMRSLMGRFGPIVAMNVSTAIRVTYHLYQGPFAFLWVGMDGLLFGYCFLRWQRIWPLAGTHVLLDFVSLA
jgi:membrane protease YdiL (CAAX protease family)